jgi:hypothetical protein
VIDVEWNGESSCKYRLSRAKVLEKMQVFMDKLERHYGQRPIIYTAPDFYRDNLTGEFKDYPFWLRSVAAHPSQGLSGPQVGVLAVFRLRPVALASTGARSTSTSSSSSWRKLRLATRAEIAFAIFSDPYVSKHRP